MRNSDTALLGPLLQQWAREHTTGSLAFQLTEEMQTCFLHAMRVWMAWVFCPPLWWWWVQGACSGLCFYSKHAVFAPDSLEEAAKSLCLFVSHVQNLSQLHCASSYFQSLIVSLFFVSGREFCSGISSAAPQQGVLGPATCPTEGPGGSAQGKSCCGVQPMIEIQSVPTLSCDCLMEKDRVCISAFPLLAQYLPTSHE